jgi:RNA polymerase sigma-70 factor (ECF subfamily)
VVQDAGVRVSTDRLEMVYREQGARLWRALVAYTGDREVASDAVGEAFAQALARGDALRDPAAWVWHVAFIVARAELKKRAQPAPAGAEGSYELADPLPHVFAALARISPNQRLAVVLHDYADRPTDEIATVLGSSRATVHVHLSNGRRRLRRILETTDD